MKKTAIVLVCYSLLTSCSVFHKAKYGCPGNGRNIGAEKLASGDQDALKASSKAKFKGIQSY